MKLKLHFIPHQQLQRETTAWFIPSPDPALWLSVISDAGYALREVEVRVVPTTMDDRTPLGALLSKPGWTIRPTPIAQPYGQVAGCLYLPIHAKLRPAMSDLELAKQLLTASAVYHPAVGLVGYEAEDVQCALAYIEPRVPCESGWAMPEPGTEIVKRLRSLEPIELLSLDDVVDQLGSDIDKRSLEELPPAPNEGKPKPWGKAGQGAVSGVAGLVGWLTSQAPGTAAKRTWVDAVHDWAMSHKRQPGQADQEQRNKEVNRLIEMLKRSPQQGLSFAIPMSGLNSARGTGYSGNQLTRRSTGFSLSGLFGGEAADPWDIAQKQQEELIRSYRKLAVQEAQAGRYRRAAYIYATLLGDIEASARVLEEGGHYDESAVILRDKLKRPIAAAECLQRGGRLSEAITLYLDNGKWVEAAKLYEQLNQIDQAHKWYRHAADELTQARDFIGAAKLYEEKLSDLDQAQDVLSRGWQPPYSDWECVPALFDLTGRHGLHDSAQAAIGDLVGKNPGYEHAGLVAKTLSDVYKCYPDSETRQVIVGQVMRLAGEYLPNRRLPAQAQPFTQAIAALNPDDKLLARDTRRYLEQLGRAMPVPVHKPTPQQQKQKVLSLGARANAPAGTWCRLFASKQNLYLVGETSNRREHLYVSAIERLEGDKPVVSSTPVKTARWDPDAPFASQVICEMVAYPSGYTPCLYMSVIGRPRIPFTRRFQNDTYLHIGGIDAMPDTVLAVSGTQPNQTWVLTGTLADTPELVLNAYSTKFDLIQSIPVLLNEEQVEALYNLSNPPVICLHTRKEYVILTIGPLVMKFVGDEMIDHWIESLPIVSIRGAVPFGRSRYVLFFEQGLRIIWDQPGRESTDQLALTSISDPVGTLTNTNGLLAVAHEQGCHLFSSTKYGELRLVDEISWPDGKLQPVDIVSYGTRDDLVVLFQDGSVQHCLVSPSKGKRY